MSYLARKISRDALAPTPQLIPFARALGPLNFTTLCDRVHNRDGDLRSPPERPRLRTQGRLIIISMIIAGGRGAPLPASATRSLPAMIPLRGSALHLRVRTMGGASRVDHRLGPDPRVSLSTATVAVGWSGYFSSSSADAGPPRCLQLSQAPGEERCNCRRRHTSAGCSIFQQR
jgi:hypothetical protein